MIKINLKRNEIIRDDIFEDDNLTRTVEFDFTDCDVDGWEKFLDVKDSEGNIFKIELGSDTVIPYNVTNLITRRGELHMSPVAVQKDEHGQIMRKGFKTFVLNVQETINSYGFGTPEYGDVILPILGDIEKLYEKLLVKDSEIKLTNETLIEYDNRITKNLNEITNESERNDAQDRRMDAFEVALEEGADPETAVTIINLQKDVGKAQTDIQGLRRDTDSNKSSISTTNSNLDNLSEKVSGIDALVRHTMIRSGVIDASAGSYPKPVPTSHIPRNGIIRFFWTKTDANNKHQAYGESTVLIHNNQATVVYQIDGGEGTVRMGIASDGLTPQFNQGTGYWARISFIALLNQ